jgi:hypothetical protein
VGKPIINQYANAAVIAQFRQRKRRRPSDIPIGSAQPLAHRHHGLLAAQFPQRIYRGAFHAWIAKRPD